MTESETTCWCCGQPRPESDLLRLGQHPEVGVCARCAHSLHRRAQERADQAQEAADQAQDDADEDQDRADEARELADEARELVDEARELADE